MIREGMFLKGERSLMRVRGRGQPGNKSNATAIRERHGRSHLLLPERRGTEERERKSRLEKGNMSDLPSPLFR